MRRWAVGLLASLWLALVGACGPGGLPAFADPPDAGLTGDAGER